MLPCFIYMAVAESVLYLGWVAHLGTFLVEAGFEISLAHSYFPLESEFYQPAMFHFISLPARGPYYDAFEQ